MAAIHSISGKGRRRGLGTTAARIRRLQERLERARYGKAHGGGIFRNALRFLHEGNVTSTEALDPIIDRPDWLAKPANRKIFVGSAAGPGTEVAACVRVDLWPQAGDD